MNCKFLYQEKGIREREEEGEEENAEKDGKTITERVGEEQREEWESSRDRVIDAKLGT